MTIPSPEKIALFIALATMLCAAPGPTMLFTISQGLTKSKVRVIAGLCGTVSANIIWVIFSAFGVAAFIRDSNTLFLWLKYIGAAYLLYLGTITFLRAKSENHQLSSQDNVPLVSVYCQGFLTTMTNPKALLCYLSFLPQFVTGDNSYAVETLLWGFGYIGIIILVLSCFGLIANRLAHLIDSQRIQIISKRTVGLSLVAASLSTLKS